MQRCGKERGGTQVRRFAWLVRKVAFVSLPVVSFWGLLFALKGYFHVAVASMVRGASPSAGQSSGKQESRLTFQASPSMVTWSSVEGRSPSLGLRGCKRELSGGLTCDILSGTLGRMPLLDLRFSVPSQQQVLLSEVPVESWGGRRSVGWDRVFCMGTFSGCGRFSLYSSLLLKSDRCRAQCYSYQTCLDVLKGKST